MKHYKPLIVSLFLPVVLILVACQSEPQVVEVEKQVTVEVEKEVKVVETVEVEKVVEVEVTRVVEAEPAVQTSDSQTVWSSGPLIIGSCCDEPNSIDPAVAIDIPGTQIITAAYDGLTRYRPGLPQIEPWLATDWEVSDDAKTYTFHLREGVKFHDGTDLTAEAVKLSFDRVKEMELGVAFFLDSVSEVNIIDDLTVEVVLTEPDITFWYGVPRIKIISPTALRENENDGDWAQDFFRQNAVGTGPYRLDKWEPGRQIEMVAFEDYWGGWQGNHIPGMVVRYGLDQPTKLLLLEDGEIHLLGQMGVSDARRLEANPNIKVVNTDVIRGYYHTLNNKRGPLQDPRVREAMVLAFPYEKMMEVMQGSATPLTSAVTSNMAGYCKVFEPKQDLERARELLAEAGYADGLELRMNFLSFLEPERFSSQLFQEALAEIGVTLTLEDIQWGTLLEAESQVDTAPDFAALYVTSPVPYAGAQLFRLGHSSIQGSSYNWQYYENPEFDALVEEAQRRLATDPERDELLCEAQRIFMGDFALIPIMNQQRIDAYRTNLIGYEYDPYGYVHNVHLHDLYLEDVN